jgi:penicillin amidase
LLTSLAFQHLRKAIGERAAPGKSAAYESAISFAVVERLMRSRPKEWFPDWDRVLTQALTDAAEEGARMQGSDPVKWNWGRNNQARIANPILGDVYWLGKYMRIGPTPMSGAPTTVKQTTPRHGPSMRFVADLSEWDRSLMNLTTGQSGQPLSSHYKDQWQAYYVGESFPMRFSKLEGGDALRFVPLR